MADILNDSPIELIYEYMYHLAPKDINNLASVSSRFTDIIKDDRFWKDYLKTRYDINIYFDRLSAREVAFKIDEIITYMFKLDIYPTFRLIPEIARYMTILDHYDLFYDSLIKAIDDLKDHRLMGFNLIFRMFHHYNEVYLCNDEYNKYFSSYRFNIGAEIEKNNLKDADPSQPDEKVYEFYNKINDFVLIQTSYLTPLGLKTINFDADHLYYLIVRRRILSFLVSNNILELLDYIDLINWNKDSIIRQTLIA